MMVDVFDDDDPTNVKFEKFGEALHRRVDDLEENVQDQVVKLGGAVSDLRQTVSNHVIEEREYREKHDRLQADSNETLAALKDTLGVMTSAMNSNTESIKSIIKDNQDQRVDINKLLEHMDIMQPAEKGVIWIRITGNAVMWLAGVVILFGGAYKVLEGVLF